MKKLTIREMTLCSLFTVLIIIGTFIKIPVPVVPFTLQFLFTTLAGLLLGSCLGAISVTIYMLLGLMGLPVFAEGGGIGYIFMPTFGYIIGFIAGTFVTGYISKHAQSIRTSFWRDVVASFSGLLVVYAIGMIYYYIIGNYVISQPIALWPLFLYCFLLAVPGDICLCILASAMSKRLRSILYR